MTRPGLLCRVAACALFAAGCGDTSVDGGPLLAPDRATFPPVADAIEPRCSTLDCHGSPGRNLRLYAGRGLRLDPAATPGTDATTEAEYDASYRAIVGLEPEILSDVVGDEGSRPERLTLVRKARGAEHHDPGAVIVAGDATDRCILAWLSSKQDEEACLEAADFSRPADDEAP